MLLCGMQENDITPPLGLIVPGYFSGRRGTGVLDPLYAKAIVLDDGKTVLCAVAVDMVGVSAEQVTRIRGRIREHTGIEEGNIMVSATHTHTGGPSAGWGLHVFPDAAYIDYFTARAADAAIVAYRKRRACAIGCGSTSENRISFHRRYVLRDGTVRTNPGNRRDELVRPDGPIDPEVGVIRVDGADGAPIGVVTNFACHLDTVGGTELSGDYPGELSRRIKRALGENAVSLFLTGPCGNINHINFMEKDSVRPNHHIWMGELLAEDVLRTREGIRTSAEWPLSAKRGVLALARRRPGRADMERAERTLEEVPYDEEGLARFDARQIDRFYAEVMMQIRGDAAWNGPVEAEVQAFRIGDIGLVAIPGEYFVEFGLEIKGRSKRSCNMINTLANGSLGYIPTRRALAAGGYESRLCYSSCLDEAAGYRIVEEAVRLLNE